MSLISTSPRDSEGISSETTHFGKQQIHRSLRDMRCFGFLLLAVPAVAFMPAPVPRRAAAQTALKAKHVGAGGDYYPGKVDYGNSQISIIETLRQNGQFNTLLKALDVAGLTRDLDDKSKVYTVFAPTDGAFSRKGDVDRLLADRGQLTDVLKYHVVPLFVKDKESIRAFRLSNKVTLQGGRVRVNVRPNPDGGEQLVVLNNGEAEAVEADIDAQNGTIHAIDGVLNPQAGTTIPLK